MVKRFAARFNSLFNQVDVMACPSMASATLPNDAIPPDATSFNGPNPLRGFTAPFNFSRNPTLSMPGGDGKGAPPPSLQLVGRLLRRGDADSRRRGLRARDRMAPAAPGGVILLS